MKDEGGCGRGECGRIEDGVRRKEEAMEEGVRRREKGMEDERGGSLYFAG